MGRDEEAGGALAAVAGQRILLADEAVKGGAGQPGLLDELELALDVAVQAHEQQPGIAPLRRLVEPADSEQPVPVRDRYLLHRPRHQTVARIGSADVRAERAARRLRILDPRSEEHT